MRSSEKEMSKTKDFTQVAHTKPRCREQYSLMLGRLHELTHHELSVHTVSTQIPGTMPLHTT